MKYRINNLQAIIWGDLNSEYVMLSRSNAGIQLKMYRFCYDQPQWETTNTYTEDDVDFRSLYNRISGYEGYSDPDINMSHFPSKFTFLDLAMMLERAGEKDWIFTLDEYDHEE